MKKVIDISQNKQEKEDNTDLNSKELLKRVDVENSPFQIITDTEKGVSFGVMGKYRITEPNEDAHVIQAELERITWNRIIQVMMLVLENMDATKEQVTNIIKSQSNEN